MSDLEVARDPEDWQASRWCRHRNDFPYRHHDELRATVNPCNNLAHCFCCKRNLNNIDLLLELGYDFHAAVTLLDQWLRRYQLQKSQNKTRTPPFPSK
ncbi:hypothetical protein [Planctomycetes bacterium Pan216]|uniref:hypothetical protein n=1 Tax=Kolteria novifilia TaxID=2527975 RepID=UPI0011A1D77F